MTFLLSSRNGLLTAKGFPSHVRQQVSKMRVAGYTIFQETYHLTPSVMMVENVRPMYHDADKPDLDELCVELP